jgi:transcriptional regulator with XRE-family HTH domain
MAETITHLGRKISRLRELRGMKQETLAEQLGISQQAVSKIEQSENVEEHTLERIAKALNVTPAAIKNFSEELVINNIQNNYEGSNNAGSNSGINNFQCTFNPLDKYIEAVEKNEKLYEALLKAEREKIALLERLLEKK